VEGLRRWHAGDAVGAAAAFERSAAGWRDAYRPRSLVCTWAAGESVRRAGDNDAAIAVLTAVLAEATEMGFEPLAARIRRSLRLAGVRATAARTQVLAAGGLTGRERELVGLVERGLTNVEIARRLGLGRPTVARILASAMTKLGVSSRAQLAAIAPP
jgi:DNA-binding CsgD family transcriptional regulator